jgi:hypothetical protein
MRFADGSFLASYYTEDADGKCVKGASFGLYVDADGKGAWLPATRLESLSFDADDKPKRWKAAWHVPGLDIKVDSTVKPTRVLKAWGGPTVPQTRKKNPNIPLIFDCKAVVARDGRVNRTTGGGLAEYAGRAAWW